MTATDIKIGPELPQPLSAEELGARASGLTGAEVDRRHDAGESNQVDDSTSRPVSAILRSNLFTIFNGVLVVCAAAVLIVGDWRDAVFGIVLVLNLAIGILSELRSKRELDSLAVLQAPTSHALRDGKWTEVRNADLVTGDVIRIKLGDQIPADGQTLTCQGLEVDESALTGESRPVHKAVADTLMSGTAVVAGSGEMLIEVVGPEAWAQKITAQARKFSKVHSEIQESIDKVLRWVTMLLPLLIALLLWSQVRAGGQDLRAAIIFTVAGVVGMIPQGLVLLTSLNFGLAAALLARKGVLVQELPAVEVLARVDVLCLDKTGTLTTGAIRGRDLVLDPELPQKTGMASSSQDRKSVALQVLAAMVSDDTNATAHAVKSLLPETPTGLTERANLLAFNSARKWSALTFPASQEHGGRGTHPDGVEATWVFGAPEIVLADDDADDWAHETLSQAGSAGRRTVCLAATNETLEGENLPSGLRPVVMVVLEEDVRGDAKETLQYFEEQGVNVKVISGDSPTTVATIAAEVGLVHPDGGELRAKDARELPPIDTPEFVKAAIDNDVFGRVTPEQKRGLIHALQSEGHTVAMTGDGVNDALALKDADLGIAMENAAPATKAVSRLVLVNGKFSDLPGVVAEGRRIIANMERVSALFLSKTTYAILFAVLVAIFGWAYPFLPRQLTYIGTFTIGVPAFFLSLAPNLQRYRQGFLRRTLLIAVPTGIILTVAASISYHALGEGTELGQTGATITLMIGAMALLVALARPWNWWRIGLVVIMIVGAILGIVAPPVRDFFALDVPSGSQWATILIGGALAALAVAVSFVVTTKLREKTE